MQVREIAHGSPDYDRVVQLRREVLRLPLGMDYTQAQLDAESGYRHFLGEIDGRVVATAILTEDDSETAVTKQVAVDPGYQGQGLGKQIMRAVELAAWESGHRSMRLNARHYAIPFYEALGYRCEGDPFEEVGMPHRRMVLSLAPFGP